MRGTIVLTPVDNIPLLEQPRIATDFLQGLYATDKQRPTQTLIDSEILFGGRVRMTRDMALIYQSLATSLGGTAASMRLLSGLHAHSAVLMSIAKYGDRLLSVSVNAGGHMSAANIAQRLGLEIRHLPVHADRMCIDADRTLRLVKDYQPDIIFVDRSEGLKYEDFRFLGEIEGPIKLFDSSQYLPQIICGEYENPFEWGFELQLFSTHKSFPGPQKAGVVSKSAGDAWERCVRGLGTYVSSHHPESTYMFGLVLSDTEALALYTSRMLDCADVLEQKLIAEGVPVIPANSQGDPFWKRTQHIWIRPETQDRAFCFWKDLSRCRIHTNYRKLPYGLGWGLRLGVAHAASMGMQKPFASELGAIIGRVYREGFALAQRQRVRAIAEAMKPITRELVEWRNSND